MGWIKNYLVGVLLGSTALTWAEPVLKAGDQLEIRVYALPECEQFYLVGPDGRFRHPFAGEICVSGKSLSQLRATLRRRFQRNLRQPAFKLSLVLPRREAQVAVLGEVRNQGNFPLKPGMSWSDLLERAGGANKLADLSSAIVLRQGKKLPLSEVREVREGDILYVAPGRRIWVSGEVVNPGIYAVSHSSASPLEDAIRLAGGFRQTAATGRITLIRPSFSTPRVGDPLELSADLRDGDSVCVPRRQCVVLGMVNKPGPYLLNGGETLCEMLNQSQPRRGDLTRVSVVRSGHFEDPPEVYDLTGDLPVVWVHDGDVIFVPDPDGTPKIDPQIELDRLNIPGALDLYHPLFRF